MEDKKQKTGSNKSVTRTVTANGSNGIAAVTAPPIAAMGTTTVESPGTTVDTQMQQVLQLMSARTKGQASNEDVEKAVARVLSLAGMGPVEASSSSTSSSSSSIGKQRQPAKQPAPSEPKITVDTEDYDDFDDDDENDDTKLPKETKQKQEEELQDLDIEQKEVLELSRQMLHKAAYAAHRERALRAEWAPGLNDQRVVGEANSFEENFDLYH